MREPTLAALGWSDFFAQQLSQAELQRLVPMRVIGAQRTGLRIRGVQLTRNISLAGRWFQQDTCM